MKTELQTYTFEGHYRESDGGNRCDVVLAYSRDQALALAGLALVEGNEWDNERWGWSTDQFAAYAGFAALYEGEVHIDSEWADLDGKACPNCTSHGGQATLQDFAGSGAMIHECASCGYQWVPLGKKFDPNQQTSEQIETELVDRWRELISEDCATCAAAIETRAAPCDECGQMDGEPDED